MHKKIVTVLAAALTAGSLGTSATAYAANPFDDVPQGHWSYESIQTLQEEGILQGTPDGRFRGGDSLMRYEMASMVAKAYAKAKREPQKVTPEIQEALDKLGKEYYSELKKLGVRLKALEKFKPKAKITGDVRLRYIENKKNLATNKNKSVGTFEHRVRLGYSTYVRPDMMFTGRLNWGGSNGYGYEGMAADANPGDYSGYVYLDLAYFSWWHKKLQTDFGRMDFKLGMGTVAGSTQDGIYFKYSPDNKTSIGAGWAVMGPHLLGAHDWTGSDSKSAEYYGQSTPIFETSLSRAMGKATVSLSHLRMLGSPYRYNEHHWLPDGYGKWSELPLDLKQYALGISFPIVKDWAFKGEYVINRAGSLDQYKEDRPIDRNGWWAQVSKGWLNLNKKGSYEFDLVYMSMGNCAIDSQFYPHGLWVNGGNNFGRNGERGWGINGMYMLAPNVLLAADYYWVKPKNSSGDFSKYRSPWQIALNYYF